MTESDYIERKLKQLVSGNLGPVEGADAYDSESVLLLDRLTDMLREAVEFSQALGMGDLSIAPPPRGNYLASGIKALHSQLRHVSWQASQIAKGDYTQQLEFMGEFSDAFNWMAGQVSHREEELKAYRDMMMSVFDKIGSVILIADPETGEIIYLNHAAKALGAVEGERLGDMGDPLLYKLGAMKEPGLEPYEYYDPERRRWNLIHVDTISWADKKTFWLYNCVDTTMEKLEKEQLYREAQTDPLTGVYNRSGGTRIIEELVATLRHGETMCMCYIDMDGLKRVNDNYGHAEGDKLLLRFVNGLTSTLREQDVVVRMGGDEFLTLFQRQTKETAIKAMQRLLDRFEKENAEHEIPVRFSYGLIEINEHIGLSADQMIELVDEEMYRHKRQKKAEAAKAGIVTDSHGG